MKQEQNNETVKDVLQRMLKENTGVHMLDSGGESGRAWQRNQNKAFEQEPHSTFDEYGVTHNVYSWLLEKVELEITDKSESLNRMLHAYAPNPQLPNYEEFLELIGAKGLYGEGEPQTVNTYNGECLLSQTLQYALFYIDDSPYVALQIHGGADARGGYTDTHIFALNDMNELGLYSQADAQATLKDGSEWYTDDGYNWYSHTTNEKLVYEDLFKRGIKWVGF